MMWWIFSVEGGGSVKIGWCGRFGKCGVMIEEGVGR